MRKFFFIIMGIMLTIISFSIILMLRQQFLQIKIDQLNKEMYINLGEYQNLKAEWNYLNNKDYLKMLGAKYLPEMAESKNKSFGQIEKVPIK